MIMLTLILFSFLFFFPPSNWFEKWNQRLRLTALWTPAGGFTALLVLIIFFAFGLTSEDFRLIVMKPDNVPIVGLIFLVLGFLWLSMKQAIYNDKQIKAGGEPDEKSDDKEKVLVWPDLVYIELIALILCMVLLIVWSILVDAPLEEPANPASSPNPAKAPWYFLGLQELLVYFDPWLAGVVFPSLMIIGLMAIPYIDFNKKGSGYYSFKQRRMAITIFMFGWLVLWIYLILIGTFLRGPNWNFFGPFEPWTIHKIKPLTNINLSELIYIKWLNAGLPKNIFLREIFGFILVFGYFLILPPLLARTYLKNLYLKLGAFKYAVFIFLLLAMILLPLKMYLRWIINLKYVIALPEYFFNI